MGSAGCLGCFLLIELGADFVHVQAADGRNIWQRDRGESLRFINRLQEILTKHSWGLPHQDQADALA